MRDANDNQPDQLSDALAFFTEVGILNQLSRALLEAEMPDGFQTIHFSVLNNLTRRGDGKLPSDLARAFQVPRSHMTDILAKLERFGFVQHRPNPNDGRSKLVHLTDSGRVFRQKTLERARLPMQELAARFDISTLSRTLPVLVELREVMDDMRSGR